MKAKGYYIVRVAIISALVFGVCYWYFSQEEKQPVKQAVPFKSPLIVSLEKQGFQGATSSKQLQTDRNKSYLKQSYCIKHDDELQVLVRVVKDMHCQFGTHRLTTSNGTFVAEPNVGNNAYGKWLVHYNDVAEKAVLLDKNVKHLEQSGNWLYVFTDELDFDSGAVYKIDLNMRPYTAQLVTLLPNAPLLVFEGPAEGRLTPNFLIATSKGLLRLMDDPDLQALRIELYQDFWGKLDLNSGVIVNDQLVIGTKAGLIYVKVSTSLLADERGILYFTEEIETK